MLAPEIERRIDDLAARTRRLVILRGVGTVALLLAGVILVTFAADYLLRLPKGMRALSLAALVAVTAAAFLRSLWLPLRTRATSDELALRIEATFPDLKDSLISAVQLSRQIRSEEFYQSRDLARSVIALGTRSVKGLDLSRAAPGGQTYKVLGSALGVFGFLAILAAWSPYHAATWFQRICLLQGVEWRKSIVLRVDLPPEGATVARGDDFTVRVGVEKGDPGEVLIHSRVESRGRWEVRPMVRHWREEERKESYAHTFREVPQGFRFFVTGGDARTEEYRVRVMIPPSIQEIFLTVSYPAYLGRPDETFPDGNLRAPFGSRVAFQAEASHPLQRALLVTGGEGSGAPLAPGDGPRGGRTRLEGSFVVERTLWYHFAMMDDEGHSNDRPIRFRLEAVPDRPPTVKVVVPGRNIRVSPKAVVPFQVEVTDDHGIRSARLAFKVSSGYEGEGEEEQMALPTPPGPAKSMKATLPFDLAPLGAQLGDQIAYLFEAEDHLEFGGPNRGLSPSYTLLVVSPDEIEADLDARLQKVRDQIRRTIRSQQATEDATLALGRVETGWIDTLRPPLVQAELDQKKVSQAIARSARHLGAVASDMEWNRVGEESDREWISGMMGQLEEGALPRSAAAAEALLQARKEEDLARLHPVPAIQEEIVAVLDRVWRSLDKWTDFREVIRRIRDIKDDEERIKEAIQDLAPKAGGR